MPSVNPSLSCPHCSGPVALRNAGDLNAHLNANHGIYKEGDPKARSVDPSHNDRKSKGCLIIEIARDAAVANDVKENIEALEDEIVLKKNVRAGSVCAAHKTTDTHNRWETDGKALWDLTKQDLRDMLICIRTELWGVGPTLEKDANRLLMVIESENAE